MVADRLAPELLLSILGTVQRRTATGITSVPSRDLIGVLKYFRERPDIVTVGVWDLNAALPELGPLLARLNAAQQSVGFFLVRAPAPSGLVSRVERLRRLFDDDGGYAEDADPPTVPNVLASDFHALAEDVRRDLGVAHLIGITEYGVADNDTDDGFEFDITTATYQGCTLVSTYWLREVADEHSLNLSALTAWSLVAQVLVDESEDLEFHPDRGCMFDENEDDFGSLAGAITTGRIESSCRSLIRHDLTSAAESMAKILADAARVSRHARTASRRR